MDPLGMVLVAWGIGSVVLLGLVEVLAYQTKVPSISERLQGMSRSARIATVVVTVLVGILLAHFFG